ncbi:MAG: hypothetical protein CM1200mP2_35640 [Planctomycetaceae bacterium]|nr:MAG: hypothetical protein CM1200mP2_35640 [Planctomycetaceae bacterium]
MRHLCRRGRCRSVALPDFLERLAWEVKAANLDGVEVNGQLIRETVLIDGDVIRVGSLDVRLTGGGAGQAVDGNVGESEEIIPLGGSDGEIGLMPLDEDERPVGRPTAGDMPKKPAEAPPPVEARQAKVPPKPKPKSVAIPSPLLPTVSIRSTRSLKTMTMCLVIPLMMSRSMRAGTERAGRTTDR